MSDIDHATRVKNLRAVMDGAYKINDESVSTAEGIEYASDDDDMPNVIPYRYACPTYDGSSSWIEFANALDEMAEALADAINGEVPFAPGPVVVDLDTGEGFPTKVSVGILQPVMLSAEYEGERWDTLFRDPQSGTVTLRKDPTDKRRSGYDWRVVPVTELANIEWSAPR